MSQTSIYDRRAEVASQRIPPRSGEFGDDGCEGNWSDPPIRYFVRTQSHTVEIGTDEDWFILQQHLSQPGLDQLEIWAADAQEAALIFQPPHDIAVATTVPARQELFAAEYHPGLTIEKAEADFWRIYNIAMGKHPMPPGVDGPVESGKRAA